MTYMSGASMGTLLWAVVEILRVEWKKEQAPSLSDSRPPYFRRLCFPSRTTERAGDLLKACLIGPTAGEVHEDTTRRARDHSSELEELTTQRLDLRTLETFR